MKAARKAQNKIEKKPVKKAVVKKAKPVKATDWITYKVTVATHKVGSDDEACGGNHLHQLRKAEDGVWLHRKVDKKGKVESAGITTLITEHQAESFLANLKPKRTKK